MRLGYTAEYPVTIVFLVVEGIALCVVAVLTDWLPLGEYGFVARYLVLFYGLCLLALFVWTPVFLERRWRGMTLTGAPDMSLARHQPNQTLALTPGETLRLNSLPLRWQERWQIGLLFCLVFPAALGGLVLSAQPNIGRQLESLIYSAFHALRLVAPSFAPVSTAEWTLAAGPLLMGVFFLVNTLTSRHATFRETLIADDRGLTWTSPFWRTRFIAWGNIERFVACVGFPSYCVFGGQETISFHAPQPKGVETPTAPPEETITPPSQARNRARLAKEAYDAQALRLVSTIVARGGKSLLLVGGPNYTAEDVAAAPLADARTLRQVMAAPNDGRLPDSELVLRIRMSKWMFVRGAFWGGLFAPGFFLLLFLILAPGRLVALATPTLGNALTDGAVCVGFWLMGVVVVAVLRAQAFRDALPTVQANDKQLVIRGYNEKALSRADWDDVRAWAYQRSTSHGVDMNGADAVAAHGYGRHFVVETNEGKLLTWDEPAAAELDDPRLATPEARRAAYRERARDLHTLIAARTGLPLRELSPV